MRKLAFRLKTILRSKVTFIVFVLILLMMIFMFSEFTDIVTFLIFGLFWLSFKFSKMPIRFLGYFVFLLVFISCLFYSINPVISGNASISCYLITVIILVTLIRNSL